jgi:hypothetical protein
MSYHPLMGLGAVLVWVFIISPRFPRLDAYVHRIMMDVVIPIAAVIGTIMAWEKGGYRVIWAMVLGALIVMRSNEFILRRARRG